VGVRRFTRTLERGGDAKACAAPRLRRLKVLGQNVGCDAWLVRAERRRGTMYALVASSLAGMLAEERARHTQLRAPASEAS
jgi:hypothetical protein